MENAEQTPEAKIIETEFRTEHKLQQVLSLLELDDALDGKNPMDVERIVGARIEALRAQPTEEAIVNNEGPTLTLGGAPYTLRRLPIIRSRAWRRRWTDYVKEVLPKVKGLDMNNPADIALVVDVMSNETPDTVVTLVAQWCDDLVWNDPARPDDDMMNRATDAECRRVFEEILKIINPYKGLI